MHIRVCKREPGSALRVTIYIYIYIYSGTNYYTGVPLVNAYPCKSAPGKNVSLEEKTVLPMDLSLFFLPLSLSLSLFRVAFRLRIPGERYLVSWKRAGGAKFARELGYIPSCFNTPLLSRSF